MNVGSLFSGAGGLDLGLHRAGMRHLWFCESDPWRREVIGHWWPGVPVYEDVRDVALPDEGRGGVHRAGGSAEREQGVGGRIGRREVAAGGVDPRERPERAAAVEHSVSTDDRRRQAGAGLPGSVDLLTGGFPCQDVSVAGRRAGLAGNRSGLFHEFARIIHAVRPGWVLIENVPGLLTSNGGRDFGVVLGTLADLGYGVAWRIVDSRYFGVPQRRRRVFIVGTLADDDSRAAAERAGQILAVGTRCPGHPPAGGAKGTDVAVASLSGLGNGGPDDNDGQANRLVASTLKGQAGKGGSGISHEHTFVVAAPLSHGSNPNSNAAGRRREDDVNLVASHATQDPIHHHHHHHHTPALGESSHIGVSNRHGVRRLTPIECERLQAWPDGWTDPHGDASDSRRYAACGDGVTASVAAWIGRRLMDAAYRLGQP